MAESMPSSSALRPATMMLSKNSATQSESDIKSAIAPAQPDTPGQVAPLGMKPRVTAVFWDAEDTLCFLVETVNAVCVARRADNSYINGTKLLNVAGLTRGRRDGYLKSEKTRCNVKIGPMHLKGVWVPFERALFLANKYNIAEQVYPLFVHDIGALLPDSSNHHIPIAPETPQENNIRAIQDDSLSMMRRAVVNRSMRTFYELFEEDMRRSRGNEAEENASDTESVSTESSDASGILTPSETSDDLQDGDSSEVARGDHQPGSNADQTSVGSKREAQEDDGNGRSRSAAGKRPADATLKKFACPFSKRYPGLPPKCSACVSPGFAVTSRVKEHLYRTHMCPGRVLCPRCYEPFENVMRLREHVIAEERCPVVEHPSGLNEEQESMLSERRRDAAGSEAVRKRRGNAIFGARKERRSAATSEADNWREIFRICFPEVVEADIPSPYCDQQHAPSSRNLERYEQFERKRLPTQVRQELEQAAMMAPEVTPFEEVGSDLVDIIRRCQDNIYHWFRTMPDIDGGTEGNQHPRHIEPSGPPDPMNPFRTEGGQAQDRPSFSASGFNFGLNAAR